MLLSKALSYSYTASSHALVHRLQPAHHSSLILGLSSPEAVDLSSAAVFAALKMVWPFVPTLRQKHCVPTALDLFLALDPGYSFCTCVDL